jgi:serine phosphatase RsbU (regulator of sigma subunit)/Flp pilus assembly protein TadD
MKKIISFVVLIIVVNNCFYGSNSVDSLLHLVKTTKVDTVKIVAYEQLALCYRKTNKDSALYFNQKAIDAAKQSDNYQFIAETHREYALTAQANDDYVLAANYYKKAFDIHKKHKDKKGMSEAYNDIGVAYYYAGDYDVARENFEKAGEIKIEIGDSIGAGQSFNNTGIMYDILGKPIEATKLYIKALTIYENARDTNMIIGTISNIGLIYIGQKNYNEALKVYQRQKKLAKAVNNKTLYGVALTSEGTAYDYMERYIEARKSFFEALKIFEELNDKPLIAQCYNNLSVNHELTNEDDKALEYALKSIAIKKEIGSLGKIAVSQIAAAKIYNKKGQHQKAINLFNEALQNAENTGYMDYIIKAHEGLSIAFGSVKNFEKAYFHQSRFMALNDSVTNKENTEMINELEKKFQSERKEQEIALLNKTNALKDVKLEKASEESKRKSIQLYGSLIVGLILLVFAIVIFRNNQQRKKTNQLLTQKNEEITKQKEIVEEQHQEITDSISYAKRIQTALLTSDNYWEQISKEHFVLLKPKDVVSGDFFWAFQTDNNLAIWVAADCTGHGVPGAFMSMLGISFFNEIVVENGITNPSKILDKLRSKIIKALEQKGVDTQQKDGMDLALCAWDKNSDVLTFSGANNPLWVVRLIDNNLEQESENVNIFCLPEYKHCLIEYKADKQPVGLFQGEMRPFSSQQVKLQKGDTVYTFSDGYADQFGGEKGKKFKLKSFKQLLLSVQENPLSKQKQLIDMQFEDWKGNLEQIDDVCVIGVKI